MQRTVSIFMVLEVGGRGGGWPQVIRNAWECFIFKVLEAPGNGAVGARIMKNASDDHQIHGFGSRWEGGGWLQNHKACLGPSSFSCLWKVGAGRLASES